MINNVCKTITKKILYIDTTIYKITFLLPSLLCPLFFFTKKKNQVAIILSGKLLEKVITHFHTMN